VGAGPGLQAVVAAEGITHRVTPLPAPALDSVIVDRLDRIAAPLERPVERPIGQ
jgi:hypothetical protein